MRNSRGQLFSLGLVFLTMFLCGSVILLYGVQQDNVESSLVSPTAVLEVRDALEIFEMREEALVRDSVVEIRSSGLFEESDLELVEGIREDFIDGVVADEKMMDFIFEDLVFMGREFEDDGRRDGRKFLDEQVYSEVVSGDDGWSFERVVLGKRMLLDEERVIFPVWFEAEFERKILGIGF